MKHWIVPYMCFSLWFAFPLNAQQFNEMTAHLDGFNKIEKDSLITAYISVAGGLPLMEGDTMIFLARSVNGVPKLKSGFNGFLNPRYVTDPSTGVMTSIPGTDWFFLKKKLLQDARIFYQIYSDSATYNDPLNPLLGFRFNMINSEARMPGFQLDSTLVTNPFVARGTVQPLEVPSKIFDEPRTVQIYLPAHYHQSTTNYPTVYFHDGSVYITMGQVPQILDNLIESKKIPPIIAVFDDPLIRGKEYRGDEHYIRYVNDELVPFVDQNYRTLTDPESRVVVGGSRGGLSSLILSHSVDKFSKCGVFSPAIHPRQMDDFTHFLSSSGVAPKQVVMVGALYDGIWYPDAVDLKEYFEQTPIEFDYHEISAGHNIQSWMPELGTILSGFFGVKNP